MRCKLVQHIFTAKAFLTIRTLGLKWLSKFKITRYYEEDNKQTKHNFCNTLCCEQYYLKGRLTFSDLDFMFLLFFTVFFFSVSLALSSSREEEDFSSSSSEESLLFWLEVVSFNGVKAYYSYRAHERQVTAH